MRAGNNRAGRRVLRLRESRRARRDHPVLLVATARGRRVTSLALIAFLYFATHLPGRDRAWEPRLPQCAARRTAPVRCSQRLEQERVSASGSLQRHTDGTGRSWPLSWRQSDGRTSAQDASASSASRASGSAQPRRSTAYIDGDELGHTEGTPGREGALAS
jgi:hypothetical protein